MSHDTCRPVRGGVVCFKYLLPLNPWSLAIKGTERPMGSCWCSVLSLTHGGSLACLSTGCLYRMLTSCAAGFRCPPLSPSKVQLDKGGGGVGRMPSAASSLGQRPWPLLEEEGVCFLWIVLVPSQRPLEKTPGNLRSLLRETVLAMHSWFHCSSCDRLKWWSLQS